MNIKFPFGKRKNPANPEGTVVELSSRIRNGNLRQLSYKDYASLFDYGGHIDAFLERLFTGEIDYGNGNVCDNLIDDITGQAEADLEVQRIAHRDSIHTLAGQREADLHAYEKQLEKKTEELAEIRARLEAVNERFIKSQFRKEHKNV